LSLIAALLLAAPLIACKGSVSSAEGVPATVHARAGSAGTSGKTAVDTGGESASAASRTALDAGTASNPPAAGTLAAIGGAGAAAGSSGASSGSAGKPAPPPRCTPNPSGRTSFTPTGTPPKLTSGQWSNISPPGLYRPRGSVPSYGCMDIQIDPCNSAVLYLTTDSEGMWRSTDAGASWTEIGKNLPTPVSPGVMQIDPSNPQHMYYIGGVRGQSGGFWVSNDSGDTWTQPAGFLEKANNSVGGWVNDVYDVKADPNDFKHVLLGFHSGWEWKSDAGVLESKDGGESWIRHPPMAGWGNGHSVWFLSNSNTWLLGTQTNGYWRTEDGGANWKKVSDQLMQHGGTSAYYSKKNGALYVGALFQILRSFDDGKTFDLVAPKVGDGYYAIVGDGKFLYAQPGNTGQNGTRMPGNYIVSNEDDGVTWKNLNDQTFSDGPYRMAFDELQGVVYSSNWNDGVWALKVQ